jgi:hypothetical protein
VNQLPELLRNKKPRDHGQLRSVVVWPWMAIVASPLVTGCGARTELPIPSPPPGPDYMVLLPTSVEDDDFTQTLSLWHSRTKTISTVGTYASEQATMSFDGRFIAVDDCSAGCAGAQGALDIIAPDGTLVWSQADTTGQTSWEWLGALRPDGQRVLVSTLTPPGADFSLCVLDRGSTPVPIRTEAVHDFVYEASYSPDGQTIVARHSNSSAHASETLVTMRDDGTQYTTLTGLDELDAGAGFHAPSFNFDGTAVVYTHLRSPNVQGVVQEVVVVDLASHESQIVYSSTQQSWHVGRFTPDGSAIVIQELDEPNVETLRHIDLATGEASILWQGHATFDSYTNVAVAADG